jgi:thiosulfate reductase cytochrome b subunit
MKIYLYPLWLRSWHWINALLFVLLILSGISLHYADNQALLMPFKTAIAVHNSAGILLSLLYLAFVIGNILSGNYKQYIPALRGFISRAKLQTRYYLAGIFKGEAHPFDVSADEKFNPLQQITYLSIMYVMMPLIVVTGWFMMFPEFAPEEVLGLAGIWPMATAHAAAGFFLSLFMLGHIYLATTGTKVSSNFKSMVDGWHHHPEHEHTEPLIES